MPALNTVIDNPTLKEAPRSAQPRAVEHGDARRLLLGRTMHVVGHDAWSAAAAIASDSSGLIVTNAHPADRAKFIRSVNGRMPIILEPGSLRGSVATVSSPFLLPKAPGAKAAHALSAALDAQRDAGSDLAMTPTGQIRKGQFETLHAAVDAANDADRQDTVLVLSVAAAFLDNERGRRELVEAINQSRHPVGLTFISSKRPIGSLRRLRAFRRVIHLAGSNTFPYRIDLAGLDARAHGALGAGIGSRHSTRRLYPVPWKGQGPDPKYLAPHMLLADLAQFVSPVTMREQWFMRSGMALSCPCDSCLGRPVSRLTDEKHDRDAGHLHNILETERLAAALGAGQLHDSWHRYMASIPAAFSRLNGHLGRQRPLPVPDDIGVWGQDLEGASGLS